jgi:[protein-PII] uridylyltransferase
MRLLTKSINSFELSYAPRKNDSILKLTVPENQKGIIYKMTAVLFAHGWDIKEAIFETMGEGLVKDLFIIQNREKKPLSPIELDRIQKDLLSLFKGDCSVIDYVENFPDLPLLKPSQTPPIIQIYNPISSDSTVLDLKTQDRQGLLFEISQVLYVFDTDILSVTAKTENGIVRDTFLLRKDISETLDFEMREKIKNTLMNIL